MHAVIFIVLSLLSIFTDLKFERIIDNRSRPTLFADLNLEINYQIKYILLVTFFQFSF